MSDATQAVEIHVQNLGPNVVSMTIEKPNGDVFLMNTPERLAAIARGVR